MTLKPKTQNILYYVALGVAVVALIGYVVLPKANNLDVVTAKYQAQAMELVSEQAVPLTDETATQDPSGAVAVPQTRSAPMIQTADELEKFFDVIYAFVQDIFALILSFAAAFYAIWVKIKTGKPGTGGAVPTVAATIAPVVTKKRTRTVKKT